MHPYLVLPPKDNDGAIERGAGLCNVLDGKVFSLTGLEGGIFLDLRQFEAVLYALGFSYKPRNEDFGQTKFYIGIAAGRAGTPQDGTKYKVAVAGSAGWFLKVVAVRMLELGNAVLGAVDRTGPTSHRQPSTPGAGGGPRSA